MWAARPHLGSIFEKLLHRKTFQLPAARIFEQSVFIKAIVSHETLHKNCTCSNETGAMNLFFEKTIFSVRQKGGSTPAFAYQLAAIAAGTTCYKI